MFKLSTFLPIYSQYVHRLAVGVAVYGHAVGDTSIVIRSN